MTPKQNQPTPAAVPAPQVAAPPPPVAPAQPMEASAPVKTAEPVGAEVIHTMPMEYYQGVKTSAGVSGNVAAPAGEKKGGKKGLTIIVIIILVVLVAGSAWLLYQSMQTPAPAVTPQLGEAPAAPAVEVPVVPEEEVAITEIPVVETEVAEEEIPEIEAFDPSKIRQTALSMVGSLDTDKDGLTDVEENLIGTNAGLSDTDGDGYPDGGELKNLYSPIDATAVMLSEKDFVKLYTNEQWGYSLLYPSTWLLNAVDEAGRDVMITSARNEFVNVLMSEKAPEQSLEDWYLEKAPDVNKSDLKSYTTTEKLTVIESPDAFTVYLAKEDTVYIINYNIGLKETADFPALFGMIVNSFQFLTK